MLSCYKSDQLIVFTVILRSLCDQTTGTGTPPMLYLSTFASLKYMKTHLVALIGITHFFDQLIRILKSVSGAHESGSPVISHRRTI